MPVCCLPPLWNTCCIPISLTPKRYSGHVDGHEDENWGALLCSISFVARSVSIFSLPHMNERCQIGKILLNSSKKGQKTIWTVNQTATEIKTVTSKDWIKILNKYSFIWPENINTCHRGFSKLGKPKFAPLHACYGESALFIDPWFTFPTITSLIKGISWGHNISDFVSDGTITSWSVHQLHGCWFYGLNSLWG